MLSGMQTGRIDGILMEALPLLEGIFGEFVVFRGIPFKHGRLELDANTRAELAHDAFGIVEQIISVDHADLDSTLFIGVTIGCSVRLLTGNLGTDSSSAAEVIKDSSLLIVASFSRHEVVEAGDIVERRNSASPVTRNAVTRMADKESKVELLEDLLWDDSWVTWLGDGRVRVGSGLLAVVIGVAVRDWEGVDCGRGDGLQGVIAIRQ